MRRASPEIGVGAAAANEALPPDIYFRAGLTSLSEFREVWFIGQRLPLCIEAHALQGWARVYEENGSGQILHDVNGKPISKTLYGYVEIRLMHADFRVDYDSHNYVGSTNERRIHAEALAV